MSLNAVGQAREDLAGLLREHLDRPVCAHVPERVTAPCVVIEPGGPWLEPSDRAGWWLVAFDVLPVVAHTTNAAATSALDQAVAETVMAIGQSAQWWVTESGPPEVLTYNGVPHLCAPITVRTEIDMNQPEGD